MIRDLTTQLGQELRQYNKYEDTLDVFVNILIKRSPTVFVLINMTLMIWLVQTIYSSRLDSIPRSIYFFAPYFDAEPLINIYPTKSTHCSQDFQQNILKTFPTIKQDHINRKNLSKWDFNSIIFCTENGKTVANFSAECGFNQTYCSGYCVQDVSRCPITSIKRIQKNDKIPTGFKQFYESNDGFYKYIYSRESKNDYIVGLSAQFQYRCANDFKYYDKYDKFSLYWNETKKCGDQGSLPTQIFKTFHEMPVKAFLMNNDIWSPEIEGYANSNSEVYLGTVSLIKFNNKTLQCNKAQFFSRQLKTRITDEPVKPTFTQSILIIAFVFFTVSWGWLLGYYCFQGSRKQKNMIVILMCIIQLIVIWFLYSQNAEMFETEQLISQIAGCVQTQLQATSHWTFGITNSSPFKSILFCCTCFLLLQIIAHFMDRLIYVPYYSVDPYPKPQQQDGQNCCHC